MANAKITQLTALTTVDGSDLLAIVDDPSGSPVTKKITRNNLLGEFGKKTVGIMLVAPGTDVAADTDIAFYTIPAELNGMNLVAVHAEHKTAGTTGVTTYDINKNGTTMLSTKLTVDSAETGSDTAATAAVIDTAADDVATNDVITIDCDGVSTTAPQGSFIRMTFQLP